MRLSVFMVLCAGFACQRSPLADGEGSGATGESDETTSPTTTLPTTSTAAATSTDVETGSDSRDGGSTDAGSDDATSSTTGLECSFNQVACGGECVSLWSDVDHCGRCFSACAGGEECSQSTCVRYCEPFEPESCPEGFKCTAGSVRGEFWGSWLCQPLLGDLGHDEPCDHMGQEHDGLDDCALGFLCLGDYDDRGHGHCMAYCYAETDCDAAHVCIYVNSDVGNVCMERCNPLGDACAASDGNCIGVGGELACFWPYDMPAAYGEECEYIDVCAPGLACEIDAVPGCKWGCCTAFCDISQPDSCPDAALGQVCDPFYAPGTAPAGLENVGVCRLI